MALKCLVGVLLLTSAFPALAGPSPEIVLTPSFVTKVRCEGRLLISAIGNEGLVRLEALPKEIGCGVILKPNGPAGETNLLLETSTGTVKRMIRVTGSKGSAPGRFEIVVRADEEAQE